MFLIYWGCLLFPRFCNIGWYRVAMATAVIPFGIGGILMNVLRYARNELRDFSSFEILCIAALILMQDWPDANCEAVKADTYAWPGNR